jgi:hypothetical protein
MAHGLALTVSECDLSAVCAARTPAGEQVTGRHGIGPKLGTRRLQEEREKQEREKREREKKQADKDRARRAKDKDKLRQQLARQRSPRQRGSVSSARQLASAKRGAAQHGRVPKEVKLALKEVVSRVVQQARASRSKRPAKTAETRRDKTAVQVAGVIERMVKTIERRARVADRAVERRAVRRDRAEIKAVLVQVRKHRPRAVARCTQMCGMCTVLYCPPLDGVAVLVLARLGHLIPRSSTTVI